MVTQTTLCCTNAFNKLNHITVQRAQSQLYFITKSHVLVITYICTKMSFSKVERFSISLHKIPVTAFCCEKLLKTKPPYR